MATIATLVPGLLEVTPAPDAGSAWQSPNLYLLGREDLTLIDSGYARESTYAAVRAAVGKARLERIILTHAHVDHAGGAWELRKTYGAEVLLHPAEEPALVRRFPGHHPDRWLAANEKIAAGEFRLRVIVTPGHARGHAALFDEGRGAFFSGDLVTGEGSTLVVPPEGNMLAYMNSLREIRKLPIRNLYPGHGPLVSDPARRIAELIEHRELREICIARCLAEKSLNLTQLVQAMYLGLIHPQFIGAAAGTAWAHLEKLLAEGKVIAEPPEEKNPFAQVFRLAPGLTLPF